MALKLVEVEQPIRNAIEIIGEYCSQHNCDDCPLAIFEYECLTNKDPDKWWAYMLADTPQTDCENCAESGSYKCTKCDGEMYYKDTPQTERSK